MVFKKLFDNWRASSAKKAAKSAAAKESAAHKEWAAYDYSGYKITPCPKAVPNGWRIEAMIEKTCDGEIKTHHFVRSDVVGGEKTALDLIATKTKICIDQQGDNLFS